MGSGGGGGVGWSVGRWGMGGVMWGVRVRGRGRGCRGRSRSRVKVGVGVEGGVGWDEVGWGGFG